MTCKDCIHYAICSKKHWRIESNKYTCERCNDFKDKSRIIELPCKVGDEIYVLNIGNIPQK